MKAVAIDQLLKKAPAGLQIKAFNVRGDGLERQAADDPAHRDDHYIFFLLSAGSGTLTVNFQEVEVTEGCLYYILPTQIHTRIRTSHAEGWFLAIDTSLIPSACKEVFDCRFRLQQPVRLTPEEQLRYRQLLGWLQAEFTDMQGHPFYVQIIHALAQSFLGMAAGTFGASALVSVNPGRAGELARQFKALLFHHFRTLKSPSGYAARLHVSAGHLNEVVRKVTGSSVSYWIQQEICSEARRLLHDSDIDVREIAYDLGYTDHAYFIRAFKKVTGSTPLQFRALSRKGV